MGFATESCEDVAVNTTAEPIFAFSGPVAGADFVDGEFASIASEVLARKAVHDIGTSESERVAVVKLGGAVACEVPFSFACVADGVSEGRKGLILLVDLGDAVG